MSIETKDLTFSYVCPAPLLMEVLDASLYEVIKIQLQQANNLHRSLQENPSFKNDSFSQKSIQNLKTSLAIVQCLAKQNEDDLIYPLDEKSLERPIFLKQLALPYSWKTSEEDDKVEITWDAFKALPDQLEASLTAIQLVADRSIPKKF